MSEKPSLRKFVQEHVLRRKPPEKEADLSPEQKAKNAFLEVIAVSLTPEGITDINIYEPPNATFDLTKLGDGAVFRVENNQKVMLGKNSVDIDELVYGCVVVDEKTGQRMLFIPKDVLPGSGKRLVTDSINSPDGLRDNHRTLRVKQIPFNTPLLDWNNPFETLSPEFFTEEDLPLVVTIFSIELVSGGRPVRQKSGNAVPQSNSIKISGAVPNPT